MTDCHLFFYQDAEARAMAKERQKKDNHNLSEFYALYLPLPFHLQALLV